MAEGNAAHRVWIPTTTMVLAAGTLVYLSQYEGETLDRQTRVMIGYGVVSFTALVLALWLLFLSGLRWYVRLLVFAVVVGIGFGAIRDFDNEGDMLPFPVWRWEKTASERVAADRATRTKAEAMPIPAATPEDFPEYRNVRRDGVVTNLTLARDWSANPPKERWRQPAGEGYAGFSVVGNAAVTIEQRGANEAVVCYDADTGRERWLHEYPAEFRETLGGDGPRTNPTVAGGDVFSVGATGMLVRLDGATGKVKWQADILKGNENITWGMSGSALVTDKLVIVTPGAQVEKAHGRGVIAYDRETGKEVWSAGTRKAGYASPMLATLAGVPQVLVFDAAAVAGHAPADGKELWSYPWAHDPPINVAQPLVIDDNRVYISAGYGMGGAMLKVAKDGDVLTVEKLWENKRLKCKFTSPVLFRGHIYGLDDGTMVCLNVETGKQVWKGERFGHGQILLADDLIVVGAENGRLALVEASPAAFKEVATMRALPGDKNWNHLTLARGRAYLRNHKEMVCYDLPKKD